ncbi:hypothetical protein ACHAPA_007705 [Fusarium lateritium]
MKEHKFDPGTIEEIFRFAITPGRKRVIFLCRNDKGKSVAISEHHLQAKKPNLVHAFWRKHRRMRSKMDGRKIATRLEEVHVHKILNHTATGDIPDAFQVQHQGYPRKDATYEPFDKVWFQQKALVEKYVEEQEHLLLPEGLDYDDESTSDEELFDDEDSSDTEEGDDNTNTIANGQDENLIQG